MNNTNTATKEWPDYATESLARQLASIKGLHLRAPVESIERQYTKALEDELGSMRRVVDSGRDERNDFWISVGYRAQTQAYADELQLARFKAALESPEYAYTTAGHPVSPDRFHVYHQDPKSPTGVWHKMSHDKTPEARALMGARAAYEGGKAGNPPRG